MTKRKRKKEGKESTNPLSKANIAAGPHNQTPKVHFSEERQAGVRFFILSMSRSKKGIFEETPGSSTTWSQ
jgi:hypothetical protein